MLLEAPRGRGGRVLFGALLILLRAPMGSRALEDLEMAVFGSHFASLCVPGAPVRLQPLEDRVMQF